MVVVISNIHFSVILKFYQSSRQEISEQKNVYNANYYESEIIYWYLTGIFYIKYLYWIYFAWNTNYK